METNRPSEPMLAYGSSAPQGRAAPSSSPESDPFLLALSHVPLDDEEEDEEDREKIREAYADIAAGRVVSWESVRDTLLLP